MLIRINKKSNSVKENLDREYIFIPLLLNIKILDNKDTYILLSSFYVSLLALIFFSSIIYQPFEKFDNILQFNIFLNIHTSYVRFKPWKASIDYFYIS